MKTKVYYLNWDAIEQEREAKVMERLIFGFKEEEKDLHLEWYRLHEYELKSTTLEGIWMELNADDRFNGQTERSLSVGDIVELNGKMYGVNSIGWYEFKE